MRSERLLETQYTSKPVAPGLNASSLVRGLRAAVAVHRFSSRRVFVFGALTLFGDGYVFPEIVWCSERYVALRDDEFLYAGGESSVEYAGGSGYRRLEKVFDQQVSQKKMRIWLLRTSRITSGVEAWASGDAT